MLFFAEVEVEWGLVGLGSLKFVACLLETVYCAI